MLVVVCYNESGKEGIVMEITLDEVVMIVGGKELELFQVRKELAKTRQVLEQVTRGVSEDAKNKEIHLVDDDTTVDDTKGDDS